MSLPKSEVSEATLSLSEEQLTKNRVAAAMLRGWFAEEGPSEDDLWEQVKAGLDGARSSARKLFSE